MGRRIIDSKVYDTETSEQICYTHVGQELITIYRTTKGTWFTCEGNETLGLGNFEVLNDEQAKEWLLKYHKVEALKKISEILFKTDNKVFRSIYLMSLHHNREGCHGVTAFSFMQKFEQRPIQLAYIDFLIKLCIIIHRKETEIGSVSAQQGENHAHSFHHHCYRCDCHHSVCPGIVG